MDVSATAGTGLTSNTKQVGKLDSALTGLGANFDNFLTLLTTQMQNQDPLEPMDNSQLTSQLVDFASVEQSITTNQQLEQLVSLQQTSLVGTAISYIGRTIETTGNEFELRNGQGEIVFELADEAEQVTIQILGKSGQVAAELSGKGESGINAVQWDGTDKYGNKVADGVFSYRVTALDDAGDPVTVTRRKTGVVEGVDFEDGEAVLTLGKGSVSLFDVLAVR